MYLPEASEHIFEHGSPIKTKEPVAVFLWQLMLCSPVEQLGYPDESDVQTMLPRIPTWSRLAMQY